ncbi:hypothetical protein F5X68DRAFT_275769 [Plectosphaerella plurivora]|uniref:ABM domain-containing protein n=1 Tax=Plectosphaerella plurivora TaxID=936078 RepID=A0A9P8VBW5_9PEZI|nr:hypothetical protein F5X68DRAFT_275769 [Plectosphaerella plurivora]
MPFTEFVIPTLKTDPETAALFGAELGPYLVKILDTHVHPPKEKYFGKILVENGIDVSEQFRLVMGLEWHADSDFNSFIDSDDFDRFKGLVKPHSQAPPVPQLYETDLSPNGVFGSPLSEVWQVQVGEDADKVAQAKKAWEKFIAAVEAAGTVSKIQGPSLNLEEKRWVGVLGWESKEAREKILGTAEVKEAKKEFETFVFNTFTSVFSK